VDSDRNLTEDIQLDDEEKNSKGGYANRILQPESSTGVGQGTGGDVAVTGNFMRVMNQTGSGVPTMTAKLSSRRRNSPLRGRGS